MQFNFEIRKPLSETHILDLYVNGKLARGYNRRRYSLDEALKRAEHYVEVYRASVGSDLVSLSIGL